MRNAGFVIKGDICWSKDPCCLEIRAGAFLVCAEGKSAGVFSRLPERYAGLPLVDCSGRLVIPGLGELRREYDLGILKQEHGLGGGFKNKARVKTAVTGAVYLFNAGRPHPVLKYKMPRAAHLLPTAA